MNRQPSRRRDRAELIAAFERETRRMGSMATLHNHAVADFVGLHHTDHDCVDLLDWAGPLPAGEIGTHLGLSSGAITAVIDRLEATGWVRRERDPEDRRRVFVHLADQHDVDPWPAYAPLAEAIGAYRDELDGHDLEVVVEFLEFANESLTMATQHARRLTSADS